MYNMLFDLKSLRTNLGFSQVKLAHESKVSLPTIQNIDAKKANPTIDVLEKLFLALGMEFKLQPIKFDLEKAITLGVPLVSSLKKIEVHKPSSTMLKQEARKWIYALEEKTLNERDELAMIAFLVAIKDHYPTFYNEEVTCHIFEKKIKEKKTSGKIIKLRRIALNTLSKYL